MRRIAITACPYSATRHTTRILRNLGLDVGHEEMGDDGIVSWQHIHYTRADFVSEGFGDDMVLLHQVRHPLMVISQMSVIHKGYRHPLSKAPIRDLMNRQTEEICGLDLSDIHDLEWAMNIWYWWNETGMAKADSCYIIESLPQNWSWFSDLIGYPGAEMPPVRKRDNRKKNRKIYSWDDLFALDDMVAAKIAALAKDLGYDPVPYDYLDDPFYDFSSKILDYSMLKS